MAKSVSLSLIDEIRSAPGPILILGANGFLGRAFYTRLRQERHDIYGLSRSPNWRDADQTDSHLFYEERGASFKEILKRSQARVIIDLACHGAYPDQRDAARIFATNLTRVSENLQHIESLAEKPLYLLAGSSSEYGFHCDHPSEDQSSPNSLYAVSKAAASQLIQHFGKNRGLNCLGLRLFSVYGPWESPGRLIPQLILQGFKGHWPPLNHPENARDFIHIDDVLRAFLTSARRLREDPSFRGELFNVGTGRQLNLREVSRITSLLLGVKTPPSFGTAESRPWDQSIWVANLQKIQSRLGWSPEIRFEQGFAQSLEWWKKNSELLQNAGSRPLISIIVAVYKDAESLPLLVERVRDVAEVGQFDFELLLVNDCSPDEAAERILELSAQDSRVIGLNHARNSGSQISFWTGLRHARGQACVLMDGDLQDPPELLPRLVEEWQSGFPIVLAQRQSRAMSRSREWAHRLFYRLGRRYSGAPLALDVGDFGLMDRQVVEILLQNQSDRPWIRGLRALVGFRTQFVPYHRPERPFGHSTNSWWGLLAWAYQGLFLFAGEPLRLWNRWIMIALLPILLILLLVLNPSGMELWLAAVSILVLISVLMFSEILVAVYRQVLHRPRGHLESIIQSGKIKKWTTNSRL